MTPGDATRPSAAGGVPAGPLSAAEKRILSAIFERMFPADEKGPGAIDIGVVDYVERALGGAYADLVPGYRALLARIDEVARAGSGRGFAELAADEQDALIDKLERKQIPGLQRVGEREPFDLLWQHLREGLFCDPIYGGNRDMQGWRLVGFPGAQYGYTAEEQQLDFVITREPRSLADLRAASGDRS